MIKVVTVCGNGIGSSLMLKLKIEELARKMALKLMRNLLILMQR